MSMDHGVRQRFFVALIVKKLMSISHALIQKVKFQNGTQLYHLEGEGKTHEEDN